MLPGLAIPTGRELEMLRLHAGHVAGGGSRPSRALLGTASLLTQMGAMLETVLSASAVPIYATVYIVPFACAVIIAIAAVSVLT